MSPSRGSDPRDPRGPGRARTVRARVERARRLLSPRADDADRPAPLEAAFGPLELRVLESLWERDEEASVRDLQTLFPDAAYTTLMTTLDRLYKKGVLDRARRGRAYVYTPRFSRAGLRSHLARDAFEALLGAGDSRRSLRPLISSFVEAVSQRDADLLDDLERLVRDERRARERAAAQTGSPDDTADRDGTGKP